MLAIQPFVQHSSSLSLSSLSVSYSYRKGVKLLISFTSIFWSAYYHIYYSQCWASRLGLSVELIIYLTLFLSLYSYISYSNVTFLVCWTLLPGLQVAPVCWTLSPLQPPSAGLCRRFRAAFSALSGLFGHWLHASAPCRDRYPPL